MVGDPNRDSSPTISPVGPLQETTLYTLSKNAPAPAQEHGISVRDVELPLVDVAPERMDTIVSNTGGPCGHQTFGEATRRDRARPVGQEDTMIAAIYARKSTACLLAVGVGM